MPDHAYPAALNDCYKVAEYVYTNADQLGISQENIGIMGMFILKSGRICL